MSARTGTALAMSVTLGVALGLVGARFVFVNSGLSLIPWALAAFAVGWVARDRQHMLGYAALFGFALATSFMFFAYDGADPVISKAVPFCLLGLVGAIAALVPAWFGHVVRERVDA